MGRLHLIRKKIWRRILSGWLTPLSIALFVSDEVNMNQREAWRVIESQIQSDLDFLQHMGRIASDSETMSSLAEDISKLSEALRVFSGMEFKDE
jgi:hypothetical protein